MNNHNFSSVGIWVNDSPCRAFGSSNEGLCNSSECGMNLTVTGVLANHFWLSWGQDHFTASSGHSRISNMTVYKATGESFQRGSEEKKER